MIPNLPVNHDPDMNLDPKLTDAMQCLSITAYISPIHPVTFKIRLLE